MTFIIDGTAGATFPNGTNPQAAPSKVLQVVQGSFSTQFTTTSTSFVSTGLSASITPLFSTSKILVLFNNGSTFNLSGGVSVFTIYRNGSNLGQSVTGFSLVTGNADSNANICYLDSPSTTSSTTYTIYARTTSSLSLIHI